MKIIKPSYEILTPFVDVMSVYKFLEIIGRTCYKSEDKITNNSAPKFVKMITDRNHLAMIEHVHISVRFIHNRGFTHELVRHRIASFAQESTRYCNYSKDKFGNELTFIEPYWWEDSRQRNRNMWKYLAGEVERIYLSQINTGLLAQAARGGLLIDIKTEIVLTANLREWKHIFSLRTSNAAHPDMLRIMRPLQEEFVKSMPEIFG